MVPQDKITNVTQGEGFTVGEMASSHPHLRYLRANAIVTLFDGVDNALDYLTKHMPDAKRSRSSSDEGDGDFNAFDSYEQAMTTFRSKPESVVKFDVAELRIKDDHEAGSRVDYDVTGDYIDMGRYMEGIPESVGTMHNGNARNRRMNVTININQWYGISHSVITKRGERILRLIDGLEGSGVRCQLTAIESSQCNHTEVVIKHHSEPLTITDLAVVTHPEFLRRCVFRIIEHSKTYESGYGSSRSFGEAVSPEMLTVESNDEIHLFIDSNMTEARDVDARFDELERLLQWELNKTVPEVESIKVDNRGVYFKPNGMRAEKEIISEGRAAIKGE